MGTNGCPQGILAADAGLPSPWHRHLVGDRSATVPQALAALIRQTRAAMLTALAEPCSTTTLARRMSVTPGAVSQHLSVLLDAGMVTRSRIGRLVLYRRTRSGDMLADASR